MFSRLNLTVRPALVLVIAGHLGLLGCGPGGPTTYRVKGQVELIGGEVKLLAGHHVEAVLASDPTVRASGEIQQDGSFTLETLRAGVILKGAQEGTYQVQFILSDDDRENWSRAMQALAPRFLDYRTSGLSFQVPADGNVTLQVAPR